MRERNHGYRSVRSVLSRALAAFALLAGCAAILAPVTACHRTEPIRIGFLGGLTGKGADLGTSGRDGAILAVEEINRRGGIHGRPVELLIRDDRMDAAETTAAAQELAAAGAVAVIGTMASQTTVVACDALAPSGIPLVSPTASTHELSCRQDHFFRVYPALDFTAATLAHHLAQNGLRRVTLLHDIDNTAFTGAWMSVLRERIPLEGGEVVVDQPFSSREQQGFLPLVRELRASRPDALVVLANAIDTALVCQQLAKTGAPLPVFTSEWSFTGNLVTYGGASVEGVTLFHSFNVDDASERHRWFVATFQTRFGHEPDFPAFFAFDAATALFVALERHPDRPLRESLNHLGMLPGIQGDFRFDAAGDVERPLYLTRIEQGRFRRVDAENR